MRTTRAGRERAPAALRFCASEKRSERTIVRSQDEIAMICTIYYVFFLSSGCQEHISRTLAV